MKSWKLGFLTAAVLGALAVSPALAAKTKTQTFKGAISDSMCGIDHSMAAKQGMTAKACTLKCVAGGAKFVLADKAAKKVYKLDDQSRPKEFAGSDVQIEGTLKGDTIHVVSIKAAE